MAILSSLPVFDKGIAILLYDFDSIIDRHHTNSMKWDFQEGFFGKSDLLPMWVADMDFKASEPIIEAVKRSAEHGVYGYTGLPESYYESLIAWMQRRHNWTIQKDWIVFSPGVVPALHTIVKAFCEPGDNVVVQTPVYYPFFSAIQNNGCEILDNPLRLEEDQYFMDLSDLESKVNDHTKLLILCSPHNPISRIWTKDELVRLGDVCLDKNILIVSDEIHHDIVYEDFTHVPLASISTALAKNSITCTGASKTFNLAGLQTSGIIIPNVEMRDRFSAMLNSCGIYSPNLFGTVATEAAYRYGDDWLRQLLQYLQGNIDFVREYIADRIPGLRLIQPQGTYLLWLDFRDCGIPLSKLGTFVRRDARVGLEAGTIFGCKEDGFERMNIACPRSILAEGLSRIEQALNRLSTH